MPMAVPLEAVDARSPLLDAEAARRSSLLVGGRELPARPIWRGCHKRDMR